MPNKIFVYGTLKAGYSANGLMIGKCIDFNHTLKGFKMFTNGSYPMVVIGNPDDEVHGEVWEVEDVAIKDLDAYEGHPSLFARTNIGNGIQMYVYQGPTNYFNRIEDGVFDLKSRYRY